MGLAPATAFTGRLAPEQVRQFAARADFCLVYYKDCPVNLFRTSMKIRECLAMAKTVVANGVGDLAEFGRFVVRSGNGPEAYAKAILAAVAKGPKKNLAGRKYVELNYDWAVIGRKFSDRLAILVPRAS
jgi:glycosyltransferase involved in cell wall biosynthesis